MQQVGGPSRLSLSSARPGAPSTLRSVITEPPWARDEPASPTASEHELAPGRLRAHSTATSARPASSTDVLSTASSRERDAGGEHRWFPFTRRRDGLPRPSAAGAEHAVRGPSTSTARTMSPLLEGARAPDVEEAEGSGSTLRPWGLSIAMPAPAPNTLAQTKTPGWDSPWMAKPLGAPDPFGPGPAVHTGNGSSSEGRPDEGGRWARWKRSLRRFLLNNVYVPLLFRIINIGLTTAALGIAIRLRIIEKRDTTVGVLGASPTLVVVFAPLTLVHVMIAIYLEYLGRPLGLWRTSAKLAHTLVEVVFICLWSGALALCFNDYFRYFVPCTASSLSEKGDGRVPCGHQLLLIILVAVGLCMYCFNLVISLFRIFEKVKVHVAAGTFGGRGAFGRGARL